MSARTHPSHGARLLGLTFDGRPIFEPKNAGSSLTFAAAGGGKTTCVAVPIVQALLSSPDRICLAINDVKSGEIAAQIAPLCAKYRRPFAIIDDFNERPELAAYRISPNPFGDLTDVLAASVSDLPFHIANITHALIEEPKDDAKNFYWRDSPRELKDAGLGILLKHTPSLATPGGLQALLADSRTWKAALEIEAEEGEEPLRAAARQILELKEHNPEHYSQHLRAALSALKIFASGPLKEAGRHPTVTYRRMIEEGWIVCFVNPVRHADRLGPFFALQTLSLLGEKLRGAQGRLELILDEYCNAPLRDALNRITIQRAYGVRSHFLTQSRQDSVRRYGERETAILEENCTVKQWLKFSNFEEAERVSKAMGETWHVFHGLGFNSDRQAFSGSLSTGRERLFTAAELMRLPPDEQILHIADVGFIHCRKIRQNEIAPTCFDLGDNPLEGRRLTPNPKVTLTPPTIWRAS